jgi:hypothetical protein
MQHTAIVSNIPPNGRLEVPPAGMRVEALVGETYEVGLLGARAESLEIVAGPATVEATSVTFTGPGLVTVYVHSSTDSAPTTVRFMVSEQAAVDWIPSLADDVAGARRRLVLRAMAQAPWFDGTKASMMGRSLTEFGA